MPFASGATHVSQALVDLCIAYKPDKAGYVRGKILPKKTVQHDTDQIWQVSTADTLRLYDLATSDHSAVPTVTYRTNGTQTYTCQPFGAKAVLSPREMKNADKALRHELRQTQQALTSMDIQMEHLAVNQTLRSASVLTNNDTLGAGYLWDDFASTNSQPIEDLQAAIDLVSVRIGKVPSAIDGDGPRIKVVMGQFTATKLRQHPNVLGRLTYTPTGTGAILTQKILAEILNIRPEDIVITANRYTDSQQGETATTKLFMGSDVLVAYVDDSDPENDQCLGHEFVFDGLAGEDPYLVRRWRDENLGFAGVDYVGVGCMTTYKVTNPDAGFLLKGVLDVTNTDEYSTFLD
jgi:hypothetical protein